MGVQLWMPKQFSWTSAYLRSSLSSKTFVACLSGFYFTVPLDFFQFCADKNTLVLGIMLMVVELPSSQWIVISISERLVLCTCLCSWCLLVTRENLIESGFSIYYFCVHISV